MHNSTDAGSLLSTLLEADKNIKHFLSLEESTDSAIEEAEWEQNIQMYASFRLY